MIPGYHRAKGGAPQLGAKPGKEGPFGPYGDDGPPCTASEPSGEDTDAGSESA
ncbi:hypothetical protein GCM10010507_61330 [Streptomyces cinnamoneus]|uniref:Uncharacterized protein n=1 Tax=Streptomyces cinnamoneus TaxID=53446 RepID=A0A918U009_STRCJ|nr:hypothetical protein GCM10010507_61330 [Streptomyces cinnamoneus]